LKAIQSSQVQFEFTTLHWDGCNFGGLSLFHQMLVFNQICWVLFPMKSTYCGKIFMSIQVVLNAWNQFEVLNLDICALQWTSAAYNFIKGLFSIFFVGKVAHTSLVLVVKFSYQYKKVWLNEKHFSRGRFSHRCVFLLLFHCFWHFKKNLQTQWVNWMIFFPPKCCLLVLNHFVVQRFFIWVGLEIEFHLQMCF